MCGLYPVVLSDWTEPHSYVFKANNSGKVTDKEGKRSGKGRRWSVVNNKARKGV